MHSQGLVHKRILVLATLGILLPTAFLVYRSVRLQRDMLEFQNRILAEYARFSVDYAVAEIQDLIRAREREVHMHYRMVAILQEFVPAAELRRIEETYPLIEHAFLMLPDRSLVFAGHGPPRPRSLARQTAAAGTNAPGSRGGSSAETPASGALAGLSREHATAILNRVLDAETHAHLLDSSDPHFFRGLDRGVPFRLTAFGLFDASGQTYGVAGFFLDLPHVREKLLANLLEGTIDAAEGRLPPDFGKDLTFVVHDHTGERVYVHARPGERLAPDPKRYLAQAELWDALPGWTVRLVYADPKGGKYERDIWVAQTLLLLLMGTTAVVGALVSMRFMLRQMELAALKSHFVSNITHELKTPLAAIRLYTETLEQRRVDDPEQEKRFLGIIRKESARLTHLIHNILDFSRIEQDRSSYRFARDSVGDVVRDVVESYGYPLRAQGFEVQLDIQPDLPETWIDRDALRQVVLNLLDNAAKYSPSRQSIEVQVALVDGTSGAGTSAEGGAHADGAAAGRRQAGQGMVEIRVRDHGVGIPAAEQARIFAPFYRVEKGLEHDVKGAGLGLAVVKHIVEAHGGSIAVQSQPGAGSLFTIRLPVRAQPPAGAAAA